MYVNQAYISLNIHQSESALHFHVFFDPPPLLLLSVGGCFVTAGLVAGFGLVMCALLGSRARAGAARGT